jgi:two-component system, NtrC family, sensor kinase
MYDLAHFSSSDMTRCGVALRKVGADAQNMEEVGRRIVCYLYEHLIDQRTGERSCALVRFYKTHAFGDLPMPLRAFASGILSADSLPPATKCLTLLATAGVRPEWNARNMSVGHQAIPLASPELVARLPMVARLFKQFGVEIESFLATDPAMLLDLDKRTFNVFYVPDAVGSPIIPAQTDFVIPYDIRSVLGFGGVLPSGDLFAIILFSKVPISRTTAELFKPLALNVKVAVLPFEGGAAFA